MKDDSERKAKRRFIFWYGIMRFGSATGLITVLLSQYRISGQSWGEFWGLRNIVTVIIEGVLSGIFSGYLWGWTMWVAIAKQRYRNRNMYSS